MSNVIEGSEISENSIYLAIHSEADVSLAHKAIDTLKPPYILKSSQPKASDELTARMHCAIRCVAKQTTLDGEKLTEEEWKLVFVASMYGQKVVRNPNGGGWVVLQKQTRGMSGPQKFDLTEMVYAYGSQNGVMFDEDET